MLSDFLHTDISLFTRIIALWNIVRLKLEVMLLGLR
jgi:hypothetical protein